MYPQTKKEVKVLVPNELIVRDVSDYEALVQDQHTGNCLDVYYSLDHCELG